MKNILTVRCPKCGCEYLPSEIFFPKDFLGEPRNIVRNDNGEIMYYDGTNMNAHEEYECYKCGCTFNIDAKIMFDTSINVEHSFDDDFEIMLNKNDDEEDKQNNEQESLW